VEKTTRTDQEQDGRLDYPAFVPEGKPALDPRMNGTIEACGRYEQPTAKNRDQWFADPQSCHKVGLLPENSTIQVPE
jgi:hypothetical protein